MYYNVGVKFRDIWLLPTVYVKARACLALRPGSVSTSGAGGDEAGGGVAGGGVAGSMAMRGPLGRAQSARSFFFFFRILVSFAASCGCLVRPAGWTSSAE